MSADAARQRVLDRYHTPRYRGTVEQMPLVARADNPLCGDWLALGVSISDDRIVDACWEGEGCALSQAAADLVCEHIIGMTRGNAGDVQDDDAERWLDIEIRPARRKCVGLAVESLKQAMAGQ